MNSDTEPLFYTGVYTIGGGVMIGGFVVAPRIMTSSNLIINNAAKNLPLFRPACALFPAWLSVACLAIGVADVMTHSVCKDLNMPLGSSSKQVGIMNVMNAGMYALFGAQTMYYTTKFPGVFGPLVYSTIVMDWFVTYLNIRSAKKNWR